MSGLWVYRASLVRVVDGDTLFLRVERDVDFGFRREMRLSSVEEFRLEGIDTPEHTGATKAMGAAALKRVDFLLRFADDIEVESTGKDEKYGRWLGRITFEDGADAIRPATAGRIDLAEQLIREGYARAYDGKGKRLPWDPAALYPIAP